MGLTAGDHAGCFVLYHFERYITHELKGADAWYTRCAADGCRDHLVLTHTITTMVYT